LSASVQHASAWRPQHAAALSSSTTRASVRRGRFRKTRRRHPYGVDADERAAITAAGREPCVDDQTVKTYLRDLYRTLDVGNGSAPVAAKYEVARLDIPWAFGEVADPPPST
jgi:hypothetical protein